ncbi:MAG: hypothetical protein MZV63_55335 [Marinilabiliales bacterium]|nr:hypothetical protein [Marinilabiliales bacterium]
MPYTEPVFGNKMLEPRLLAVGNTAAKAALYDGTATSSVRRGITGDDTKAHITGFLGDRSSRRGELCQA